MNQRRGQILAVLSLVATAGLPLLFVLMRLRVFTFRDDFTGFNALGFAPSWALALLVNGVLLTGLLGLLLNIQLRAWRQLERIV